MTVPSRVILHIVGRHQSQALKNQVATATSCTNGVNAAQHTLGKGPEAIVFIPHRALTHIHARDRVRVGTMTLQLPLVHHTLLHQDTEKRLDRVQLEALTLSEMLRRPYGDV